MAFNNRETEVKFKIKNPADIKKKLRKAGARFLGRFFEKTRRFETPNNNLEKEGKFLRVRTGFQNVLTFKQKIKSRKFKEREEIELAISDPEKMALILKKLKYSKVLIMEKYRANWRLKKTVVSLDRLPMGVYLEIEGAKKEIEKVISLLGLNPKERIIISYWDLWRQFARKNKSKEKNIIFLNTNKKTVKVL